MTIIPGKSFSDSCQLDPNLIVFTIFRLIGNQSPLRLVPNHSGNDEYNQICVDSTRL